MLVSPLQDPLVLPFSGLRVPNRLVKAATTEKVCIYRPSDARAHGRPSTGLIRLYREWGRGNYGMIVTGNVLVDYEHLEAEGNAIIDSRICDSDEEYARDFHQLPQAARSGGGDTIIIAQLNHPGSQCTAHLQPHPVAPSNVQTKPAMGETFAKPTPLSEEQIGQVIERFAYASSVLYKAGFDGVQLHGAHGYLLTQFLSPYHNRRTDRWGGSLENRSRIIFEIIRAIRGKTPPTFSISIKLNSQDYIEDGFTTGDCEELVMKLRGVGVDFIEVTGGTYNSVEESFTYSSESTRRREAFFVVFAETISRKLRELEGDRTADDGQRDAARQGRGTTRVMLTGGFRTSTKMAEAIETNSADLIGLARPICAEQHLPRTIFHRMTSSAVERFKGVASEPMDDCSASSANISPTTSTSSNSTSDTAASSLSPPVPHPSEVQRDIHVESTLPGPSPQTTRTTKPRLPPIEICSLHFDGPASDWPSRYICRPNRLSSMGLQLAGAGAQIRDMAAGKAPRDFSKQEVAEAFLKELGIEV